MAPQDRAWRSMAAHKLGEFGVAGSSPAVLTAASCVQAAKGAPLQTGSNVGANPTDASRATSSVEEQETLTLPVRGPIPRWLTAFSSALSSVGQSIALTWRRPEVRDL